ncbi:MAG: Small ribosomal subunit biogenesis GTPase RsgA [Chlamydiae bacterium]|nr:Small ribosomal subunit biogenesis GTPase RsgA [Chlamydiota bacterium]
MPIDIEALDDEFENFEERSMRSTKLKKHSKKNASLVIGRVTFISPEFVHISYKNKIFLCCIKGTFKKRLKQEKDRICCGDLAHFDPEKKVVEKLEPRKTVLMRQNPSHKFQEQILATNVDQILITSSILEPELNSYLIDLYVISAQRSHLKPIILINKVDLLQSKKQPQSAQKKKKLIAKLKEQYNSLNIPVIPVSAVNLEGFKELQELMKDKASVFSGESGVGKSSLINAIEKINLKVGNVSTKSQKGMHTTTSSKLLPLKFGGWCVDTPGIQSLGFKNVPLIEVRNCFPELVSCGCKFSDCLHQKENGCAIEEALEKKAVSQLRLDSYYKLLEEVQSER